jgi:LPXTG-site transpeptidase (sortase) family protein
VPQSSIPAVPDGQPPAAIPGPYRLLIPRIAVDAQVVSITSGDDRVLLPPEDPDIAGWWSEGAAPGAAEGSAVFVGHTVRTGGGVFGAMGDLQPGDTLDVEGPGASLTYTVGSVEVLSKDEVAAQAEQIFDQSGPGRLVVITCADWDGEAWRSNIVTIASPS